MIWASQKRPHKLNNRVSRMANCDNGTKGCLMAYLYLYINIRYSIMRSIHTFAHAHATCDNTPNETRNWTERNGTKTHNVNVTITLRTTNTQTKANRRRMNEHGIWENPHRKCWEYYTKTFTHIVHLLIQQQTQANTTIRISLKSNIFSLP